MVWVERERMPFGGQSVLSFVPMNGRVWRIGWRSGWRELDESEDAELDAGEWREWERRTSLAQGLALLCQKWIQAPSLWDWRLRRWTWRHWRLRCWRWPCRRHRLFCGTTLREHVLFGLHALRVGESRETRGPDTGVSQDASSSHPLQEWQAAWQAGQTGKPVKRVREPGARVVGVGVGARVWGREQWPQTPVHASTLVGV